MPPLSLARAFLALRLSLAFIWLYTALCSALLSSETGFTLLAALGIRGPLAAVLLYGTSVFEVFLGLLVAWGRHTRPLALVQAALIVGFTGIITLAPGLRELWLHPFAPIAKNIPLLGGIAVLYALGDDARG